MCAGAMFTMGNKRIDIYMGYHGSDLTIEDNSS